MRRLNEFAFATAVGFVTLAILNGQIKAQETGNAGEIGYLELFSGEKIAGHVIRTTGTRIFFRTTSGMVRTYHKRAVQSATNADGQSVSCTIALTKAPLTTAQKSLLGQVASFHAAMTNPAVSKLIDGASEECVAELNRLALKKSAKNREAAIGLLSLVGSEGAVRRVVKIAVNDPDPKIRFAAANYLLKPNCIRCVKSAGLIEEVRKGFADKKRNTRFCLAYVAGKAGDVKAVPILKKNLKNSDHHFRESAALLLAELGDASGIRQLLKMAKAKKNDNECIAICQALSRLGDKKALTALKSVAKSKNARVATAASHAIEKITKADR